MSRPPTAPKPTAAAAADAASSEPSALSGAITNPTAPTPEEVTFLLALLANLKTSTDMDWDALAPALGISTSRKTCPRDLTPFAPPP